MRATVATRTGFRPRSRRVPLERGRRQDWLREVSGTRRESLTREPCRTRDRRLARRTRSAPRASHRVRPFAHGRPPVEAAARPLRGARAGAPRHRCLGRCLARRAGGPTLARYATSELVLERPTVAPPLGVRMARLVTSRLAWFQELFYRLRTELLEHVQSIYFVPMLHDLPVRDPEEGHPRVPHLLSCRSHAEPLPRVSPRGFKTVGYGIALRDEAFKAVRPSATTGWRPKESGELSQNQVSLANRRESSSTNGDARFCWEEGFEPSIV